MTQRLFEDLVVSARGRRGGRSGFGVPASVGIHAALVGGAVVLSALGPADLMPEVTARPVPLPALPTVVRVVPAPPPAVPSRPRPASPARREASSLPAAPRQAPIVSDQPLTREDDVLPSADDCSDLSCLVGSSLVPGPSAATGPDDGDGVGSGPPTLVRAVVDVAPPVKIRDVEPVYPELARLARVEGVVIIECTIDPKGRIANARVLRGHSLLDAAALDAVQRWAYTPSLLNGSPVSVVMTVTVRFTLAR